MRVPARLPPGYLKRSEAAALLGISEWRFVQAWRRQGWREESHCDVYAYKIVEVEALLEILRGELAMIDVPKREPGIVSTLKPKGRLR